MQTLFKNWWLALVKGIILIVLAILVFRHPVATILGFTIYLGIGLFLAGVIEMVTAFQLRQLEKRWGWSLAGGAIDVLFGLILLSNPGITAVVLPFVVGFWAVFYGTLLITASIASRAEDYAGPRQGWIGGALTLLAGLLIIFNPAVGIAAITILIGIALLIAGIVNILVALGLRQLKQELG